MLLCFNVPVKHWLGIMLTAQWPLASLPWSNNKALQKQTTRIPEQGYVFLIFQGQVLGVYLFGVFWWRLQERGAHKMRLFDCFLFDGGGGLPLKCLWILPTEFVISSNPS